MHMKIQAQIQIQIDTDIDEIIRKARMIGKARVPVCVLLENYNSCRTLSRKKNMDAC